MNLMQAIIAPVWASGFKVESSQCQSCHRVVALRNPAARKAGIKMHGFWYCSSACFTAAAERELSIQMRSGAKAVGQFRRMPLGLSLVNRGLLTSDQLKEAVEKQKEQGGEIGEVLVRQKMLNEEQMTQARAAQWNCPVFYAPKHSIRADVFIPPTLFRYYSAIPLHYVTATKVLLVGFVSAVEYDLLFAIEKMTGCKTQPCFVTPSDFEDQLRSRRMSSPGISVKVGKEIVLDRLKGVAAMADALCKHSVDLEADDVVVTRCKDHVWVRLACGEANIDLLFKAA